MHKTLADLMVSSRLERIQLSKQHTRQPTKREAPDVIGTNGDLSVIKAPWQLPIIERRTEYESPITRFISGPNTIDFYVLGQHRHTPGHGHRMHVLGFVPDERQVTSYPSGELSEVRFLPPSEIKGTLPSFERELAAAGLTGRLEDYVLGQTARPSIMRVDPTALSLSLKPIAIDNALARAVVQNPGLEPYRGDRPKIFYNPSKESKD